MMYSIRPKLHDAIFQISGFHDSIFPNFEVFTTQFFPIGPVQVLFPIGQGKSLTLQSVMSSPWLQTVNCIINAIITPPDVVSQLLIAMPILVLYEVGIVIAKRLEKKRALREAEFEQNKDAG